MTEEQKEKTLSRGPIFAEGIALLLAGVCIPKAIIATISMLGVSISNDLTLFIQNAGVFVLFIGLCYIAYSPLDRFVVRRGRETRKESWIWAIGMWSFLLAIVLTLAQLTMASVGQARRAADERLPKLEDSVPPPGENGNSVRSSPSRSRD